MLADRVAAAIQTGRFADDLHLPAASLDRILDFVGQHLPLWRDCSDRPARTAETDLTTQLCGYLNSAARCATGWDILQFRVEEADAVRPGRKVDLAAAPCGVVLWVGGRRRTHYDTLVPIECKRLPTPARSDRDEREYVFSALSTTGGIQRFKLGHHGGDHALGGMIAYIQSESGQIWSERVNGWIRALVDSGEAGWTASDRLNTDREDVSTGVLNLSSCHDRHAGDPIRLRHLWVQDL